jgi:hypothetical protein
MATLSSVAADSRATFESLGRDIQNGLWAMAITNGPGEKGSLKKIEE